MNFRLFFRRILPIPKLMKLNWDIVTIEKSYKKDINAASKINNQDQIRILKDCQRWEIALVEEEISHHLTQQLLKKARRLNVDVPHRSTLDQDGGEYWIQGRQTGNWYFTNRGYSCMRLAIRNELKERHEIRSHLFVWLSALTGFVGAITGLLAVFSKS